MLVEAGYVTAYYATIERVQAIQAHPPIFAGRVAGCWPQYRSGGDTAKAVFEPMHWVDRTFIRPAYWDGEGSPRTGLQVTPVGESRVIRRRALR